MTFYQDVLNMLGPRDTYGERLKLRLLVHGIKHAELAQEVGIDPARLSRYVTGRTRPDLETMLRLDEAVDELIYRGT